MAGLFVGGPGQLFGFGFLPLKVSDKRKNKANVLLVGWTKSMTEKITEGLAQGKPIKGGRSLRHENGRVLLAVGRAGLYLRG